MLVRLIAWTAIAVSTVLLASEAFAQSSSGPAGRSVWSARSAIGFTADPDAFLMSFEGDYRFSQSTSLGLLLFLGVEDDMNLVAQMSEVGVGW